MSAKRTSSTRLVFSRPGVGLASTLALTVALTLVSAAMPASAAAQDVLGLASGVALEPGAVVRVPLLFTDDPGTPLGGGSPLQGLAVTVVPSPAAAVTGLSFERAGEFANAAPRFEIETGPLSRRTWLISFSDPVPLPTVSSIAMLEVSLDPSLPADSLVTLSLVAAKSGVSNADGSVLETTMSGALQLVDGVIEVLPASLIFSDGFESGNLGEWSVAIP